ncbi:hypothetical protein [Kribbella sp. NPDC051137]|uniref:hypothetical protein n=1 Tax=Kribbella sp. NPDC051137 TaxID=3155045 RepID=UPI002F5202A7
MERLIADSLAKHAADAPTDDHLLAGVHARLHRRRTHRAIGAVVVAAAAVATALTASQATTHPQPAQQDPAPGWRWESFKTVEVQVPAGWTQYISGPAPCTFMANPAVPSIGRVNGWSASREYTCRTPVIPLAQRQPYLWFDDVQKPGIKQYDGGWTEETRAVGGVKLSVLTKDAALRQRILDSARTITDTDSYGCAPTQPLDDRGRPPATRVTAASICEYWNGDLIAGSAVPAATVSALTTGLRDTFNPHTDPLIPAGCQDPESREYVVLLRSEDRVWPVHLPYTTCVRYFPAVLSFIRTGVHHQLQPATGFDPVERIKPLAR